MKLNILAFGVTRDIVGDAKFEIELAEAATVADLQRQLRQQYPKMEGLKSLLVAVNSEYGNDDLVLKSSDEIALIPPVSGG